MADGPRSIGMVRDRIAPWAGLIAGVLGWVVHQQLLADLLYWDCHFDDPVVDIAVTACTTVLILAGAWWSWSVRRPPGEPSESLSARRLICELSVGCAGLFLLATLAQALAGLIIPECHR